jgi:hypothetical protein
MYRLKRLSEWLTTGWTFTTCIERFYLANSLRNLIGLSSEGVPLRSNR